MGMFDNFLGAHPGYFREDAEDEFPWSTSGRSIWYSLFVVENGKIEKYGFTSAKKSRANLVLALNATKSKKCKAILLGIWNGQYGTDLFILDIGKAIIKLNSE